MISRVQLQFLSCELDELQFLVYNNCCTHTPPPPKGAVNWKAHSSFLGCSGPISWVPRWNTSKLGSRWCFHILSTFRIEAQDSNEIYHFFRGGPGLRDISVEDVPWRDEMHSPSCWFQQLKWFPWMKQFESYWCVFQNGINMIKFDPADLMRHSVFFSLREVIIYYGLSLYKFIHGSCLGRLWLAVSLFWVPVTWTFRDVQRYLPICWALICSVDTSLCLGTSNVDPFSPSPRSTKPVKACQKMIYKRKQKDIYEYIVYKCRDWIPLQID